jgi:hypothetical protein
LCVANVHGTYPRGGEKRLHAFTTRAMQSMCDRLAS